MRSWLRPRSAPTGLTFGQSHLYDWWREFVLIAVLPALAVIHLVFINSQRRGSLIAA
jgi:hypothetical protein